MRQVSFLGIPILPILLASLGLAALPVFFLGTSPSVAGAAEASALINKALDEQVKLDLNDALPAAMAKITDQTGVRLKADASIWDLLPWGRDTNLQAKVENTTLRVGLEAITRTLGLTFASRDDYVEILPMPGLKRLAQRATVQELKTLDVLASRPLTLATDHPTISQLLMAVDEKLAEAKDLEVSIENRTTVAIDQSRAVFVPRNATLMDGLESLAKDTNATWYPWGKNVVIVTKEERTRRLLAKPLTFRAGAAGLDVQQLLLDLSVRTGVAIEYQPGALRSLPADAQVIRGVNGQPPIIENVPARQVLDHVSAITGLAFSVQDDKIVISLPAGGAAAPRDRAIGILQLDNGLQVLVPSSQVPPDVQEYIRDRTQKELGKIRQMMQDEGFKPAPQPATKPAEDDAL